MKLGTGLLLVSALSAGCHNPMGPKWTGPLAHSEHRRYPASVDAVSKFNSCSGHAFPDGSPNNAKNYFWPNSTNFSTVDQLRVFAACAGRIGQNSDDTNPNEQDRGQTYQPLL